MTQDIVMLDADDMLKEDPKKVVWALDWSRDGFKHDYYPADFVLKMIDDALLKRQDYIIHPKDRSHVKIRDIETKGGLALPPHFAQQLDRLERGPNVMADEATQRPGPLIQRSPARANNFAPRGRHSPSVRWRETFTIGQWDGHSPPRIARVTVQSPNWRRV